MTTLTLAGQLYRVESGTRSKRSYKRKGGEAFSYRPHMSQLVKRAGWRRALTWFRWGTTRRLGRVKPSGRGFARLADAQAPVELEMNGGAK